MGGTTLLHMYVRVVQSPAHNTVSSTSTAVYGKFDASRGGTKGKGLKSPRVTKTKGTSLRVVGRGEESLMRDPGSDSRL